MTQAEGCDGGPSTSLTKRLLAWRTLRIDRADASERLEHLHGICWLGTLTFFFFNCIADIPTCIRRLPSHYKMNDKTFQYMQSPQWLTVHNIHVDVLRHIHTHTQRQSITWRISQGQRITGAWLHSRTDTDFPGGSQQVSPPLHSAVPHAGAEEVYAFFFISFSKRNDSLYLKLSK